MAPPIELDGEQKEVWVAVTDAMPADWFGEGAVPLLVQLCRHTVQARRIAELIEQAAGNRETRLDYYDSLLRLQARETAALASLSTKLRLGPASLRNDRGHLQHQPPGRVPWEGSEHAELIGGIAALRARR